MWLVNSGESTRYVLDSSISVERHHHTGTTREYKAVRLVSHESGLNVVQVTPHLRASSVVSIRADRRTHLQAWSPRYACCHEGARIGFPARARLGSTMMLARGGIIAPSSQCGLEKLDVGLEYCGAGRCVSWYVRVGNRPLWGVG